MWGRVFRGLVLAFLFIADASVVSEVRAQAQEDKLGSLNNQVVELYRAGQYAKAIELAKRALALAEHQYGPDHPDVAQSLNNLAELYRIQGRYADAEPLFKRSLTIRETVLGPDHPDVAQSLNNLAGLYRAQGRYARAEPLYKRSRKIWEAALGPDHPHVATSLNNLAALYQAQGRYADAVPLYQRSLTIYETALGPAHPSVATTLNNLAALYEIQGRYADAAPLYKRSLEITEAALGPDHPDVASTLNNLAELYRAQGRYADAEPLYKRSRKIWETALGPDHPHVANSLNGLALLYEKQGRTADAEPLLKRSLTILETALGPDHPDVAITLNNLALLYERQGRYADAEPLYKRSRKIREAALGPDHPNVATSLNNLAGLYWVQGRYAAAEPLYQRSRKIREAALGPDHPHVAQSLNNLAGLAYAQNDWSRAVDFFRRGTQVTVDRTRRGAETIGQDLSGKSKNEAVRSRSMFSFLVKAAYRHARHDAGDEAALAGEMFQTVQWGQGSEAARALARMSARQAKGDGALARLVRERQDLVAEWQKRDQLRTTWVSQAPDKRHAKAEAENNARLEAIDTRIAAIDGRLKVDFPDYAALANPEPLSIAAVQDALSADEALVLFLDTPELEAAKEETFIWVVTKDQSRWQRADLGTKALTEKVAALRCGLDSVQWREHGRQACEAQTGRRWRARSPLPFRADIAHELYKALLAPIEAEIAGKDLLIAPSGPLNALPFQVLVTEPATTRIPSDAAAYADLAWLGQRHAITVLPSVASLKALRAHAKTSRAQEPFVGFGNPLLTGPDGNDRRAWSRQSCPGRGSTDRIQTVARAVQQKIAALFRGGLANVAKLRRIAPLPETADELCDVARASGVDPPERAVHLGSDATETQVKSLSAAGDLAKARVVHFATHGLIAGETKHFAKTRAEPSLLLTPPDEATETDDGLLTASEVTTLKLDADWVILSACNTAAAGTVGGDAFSGLARAFFYAGARALLVSHWYVDSYATVQLITGAFEALRQTPGIGRAQAMQRAMSKLIAEGGRHAHPANWAPFVVVGEGGKGR